MRLLEIHIEVADLEFSLNFYRNLLKHNRIVYWQDKSAVALVLDDGSAFGLWKKGKTGLHGGKGGKEVHFAFRIEPDEYDVYLNNLKKLGVKPIEHVWEDGHRSIYFFDADGHQGEFMTRGWPKKLNANE